MISISRKPMQPYRVYDQFSLKWPLFRAGNCSTHNGHSSQSCVIMQDAIPDLRLHLSTTGCQVGCQKEGYEDYFYHGDQRDLKDMIDRINCS